MQVIIISSKNTAHKHWQFSFGDLLAVLAILFALLATFFLTLNEQRNVSEETAYVENNVQFDAGLKEQQKNEGLKLHYAQRLGQLQAESIRLNVLTEKMAEIIGMDISIYNLSKTPAQGGLEQKGVIELSVNLDAEIEALSEVFQQQNEQLAFLENISLARGNITSAIPQGSPINEGWISSSYGYRLDPFNGKKTMHHGIDFAGKSGSAILAIADGLVTWTGKRSGYGQMIDIDHGNGYVSRYAHNKKLLVKVGTRINKGHKIALMGSTGRSTGPHVHFEILRDGKSINPYSFVKN